MRQAGRLLEHLDELVPGDEVVLDDDPGRGTFSVIRTFGTGSRRRVVCLVPGKGEFTFAPGELRMLRPVEAKPTRRKKT